MSLETLIIDYIEGRRSGRAAEKALYALSRLYRSAIALRHWAYDKKWLKSLRVGIPVVSIGNVVTGGTGKTPLVRLIAEELGKDSRVAILTRGFKSKIEKSGRFALIKQEDGSLLPPDLCGDEPYWLAASLPKAAVWVGRKRTESAAAAIERKAQVLILDDGMQHRKLDRDFEIVVMDAEDLFGKGHFLPRGYLRELPERLSEADLIVINHVRSPEHCAELKKKLASYTEAPVVGIRVVLDRDFSQKKVGAFCGIGKPDRFFSSLRSQGAEIVKQLTTPDHEAPSKKELIALARRSKAKGAEAVVCTEKDGVKLPLDLKTSLPIIPIGASLEIIAGKKQWNDLIQKIKDSIRGSKCPKNTK